MKKIKYYWKSGWILMWALLFVVALTGFLVQRGNNLDQNASKWRQELLVKTLYAKEVEEDNEQLRGKLERSAKIETSDTQKAITRMYIKKYFGDEADIAEKVFTCESNLNPMALNEKNKDGSTDRGVPQINSSNRKSFEKTTGLSYDTYAHDLEVSIKYAKWLKDNSKSGFNNWVCYKIVNK
jgi:hypothetical protein